jgi:hypothetical protein
LTSGKRFAYGNFDRSHTARDDAAATLHRKAHLFITLPCTPPYCEPGCPVRSRSDTIPVSAGVSRKRVHLFRWGSYFHKAFTGAKKTTSRERLPNPSLQRRNFAFQPWASAKTPRPNKTGTTRTVDIPQDFLTNQRHHFLIRLPKPFGPCPPCRPKPTPRHYSGIARGWTVPLRTPIAPYDTKIDAYPHIVVTTVLLPLNGATSHSS